MNNDNNKQNKPAATVAIPSNQWVKVVDLQNLTFPHLSKGGVVLHLIDREHQTMLKDLKQFLHGDNNSLDKEGTPND